MDDLISRQAAIDGKISIQRANGVEIYTDEAVPVEHLKNVPAADVVPVVHGEWERIPYSFVGGYRCSRCGQKTMENFWLYCPHCGARMIYGERKE